MTTVIRIVLLLVCAIVWSEWVFADGMAPMPVFDANHYRAGFSMRELFVYTAGILLVVEAFFVIGLMWTRRKHVRSQVPGSTGVDPAGGDQRSPAGTP